LLFLSRLYSVFKVQVRRLAALDPLLATSVTPRIKAQRREFGSIHDE